MCYGCSRKPIRFLCDFFFFVCFFLFPLKSFRRISTRHGAFQQPVRVPGAAGMAAVLLATGIGSHTPAIHSDHAWRVVHQDHVVPHAGPAHMLRDGPVVHGQRLYQVLHRALEHVEFNVSTQPPPYDLHTHTYRPPGLYYIITPTTSTITVRPAVFTRQTAPDSCVPQYIYYMRIRILLAI